MTCDSNHPGIAATGEAHAGYRPCIVPRAAIRPLVVAFSLCFSAPASVLGQETGPILDYPESSLRGIVSAETTIPAKKCRKLCETRTGCAGFDHSSVSGSCRMFATVNSAVATRGMLAATRNPVSGYRDPSNVKTPEKPRESQTAWLHNGSLMTLFLRPRVSGGSDVEIIYDVPKDQLLKAGVRPGSTLFKGMLSGRSLAGRSRLTSRRCGIVEYGVEGSFDSSSKVPFFLRGAAPRRADDCSVEQWSDTGDNANLRFDPR